MTASTKADPPAELIQRFKNERIKVQKGSDCDYNEQIGVFEKRSNSPAIVLMLGQILWKSEASMTINGGYFEGAESASKNVYRLEKRDGKWTVTKDDLKSIS